MDELLDVYDLMESTEPDAPAIIPGVLSYEDKIICVAAPKVGKSILAQQLAMCVAGDHPFLGHRPVEDDYRVLYIAGEGDVQTIRSRSRRMAHVYPVGKGRLYYWPIPSYSLNSANGLAQMLAFARQCKPTLTIIDPIYALMSGSMKDDEKAGDFVRSMNRYQKDTGSALFVVHHTHRAVKDKEGDALDENDQAYFGSMVWAAWPKSLWLMRTEGVRHNVKVSCSTNRDGPNDMLDVALTMCEPSPLLYVPRDSAMGPAVVAVNEVLKLGHALTQKEIMGWTTRSQGTVSTALDVLEKRGLVTRTNGTPSQWAHLESRNG